MNTLKFLQLREFTKVNQDSVKNGFRKHMVTKDGTEISIQRGRDIHSRPIIPYRMAFGEAVVDKSNGPFDYPEYFDQVVESVELGLYGNLLLDSDHYLLRYCDSPEEYLMDPDNDSRLYTFAYVPLRLVDRFIKEHGGFDHIKE